MIIEINDVTEEQKLAIIDYFACWKNSGNKGISKWVAFYCDGGGDFNPTVLVDGQIPEEIKEIPRRKCIGDIKVKVAPTRENGLEETIWVEEFGVYMIDPYDVKVDYTKLLNNK